MRVCPRHPLALPVIDDAASVGIGLLLAGVGVLLIRESRDVPIGEGVAPPKPLVIRDLALRKPRLRDASSPLSRYLGSDELLLKLGVEFEHDSTADEMVVAVANIEHDIGLCYPAISRIHIEAPSISSATPPPSRPRRREAR